MNSGEFVIENGILVEYKGNENVIEIPDGVKVIGDDVFLGNPITSVIMPDTVVKVGNKAFHECCELKEVRFSENLEIIGNCAFCCNAMKRVELPSKVRIIRWGAFCDYRREKLVEVILPDSLELVEDKAFSMNPMLKTVRISLKLKAAISPLAFDETCDVIWE